MFALSQFALKSLKVCNTSSLPSYSITLGILLYATLYVYLLFYQNEYVYIFNKFIIYVIGIDLLLAAFLYFKTETDYTKIASQPTIPFSDEFEYNEHLTPFQSENQEDQLDDSDDSGSESEIESITGNDTPQFDSQELEQQLHQLLGNTQDTSMVYNHQTAPPQPTQPLPTQPLPTQPLPTQPLTTQPQPTQPSVTPPSPQSNENSNINVSQISNQTANETIDDEKENTRHEEDLETEPLTMSIDKDFQPKKKRGRPPKTSLGNL
jgi:hypothetical protein